MTKGTNLHGDDQRSGRNLRGRQVHQVVLQDGQLHDILGEGVDVGVDAAGLRVAAQEVERQRSALKHERTRHVNRGQQRHQWESKAGLKNICNRLI